MRTQELITATARDLRVDSRGAETLQNSLLATTISLNKQEANGLRDFKWMAGLREGPSRAGGGNLRRIQWA